MARAAVGCRFKRHLRDRSDRFLPSNRLDRGEDVKGQFGVSNAVGHDLVGPCGPLFVHVGRADVHFVLLLIVGEEKGGDKRQGLSPRPERLACLPPCIHHDATRKVPGAIALPLGNKSVSVSLEFGFHSRRAPPAEEGVGSLPPTTPLQDSGPVCKPREVKVVDVVARDDVGVGGVNGACESFENVAFGSSKLKRLTLTGTEMLDASGRTQHRFVFDAGFQIKGKRCRAPETVRWQRRRRRRSER